MENMYIQGSLMEGTAACDVNSWLLLYACYNSDTICKTKLAIVMTGLGRKLIFNITRYLIHTKYTFSSYINVRKFFISKHT